MDIECCCTFINCLMCISNKSDVYTILLKITPQSFLSMDFFYMIVSISMFLYYFLIFYYFLTTIFW